MGNLSIYSRGQKNLETKPSLFHLRHHGGPQQDVVAPLSRRSRAGRWCHGNSGLCGAAGVEKSMGKSLGTGKNMWTTWEPSENLEKLLKSWDNLGGMRIDSSIVDIYLARANNCISSSQIFAVLL